MYTSNTIKHITLFLVFVAFAIDRSAASSVEANNDIDTTNQGFKLNKRQRKVHTLSETAYFQATDTEDELRQWKEEDYNAIMTTMSGGNLRHRQLQRGNINDYQKKPYYSSTSSSQIMVMTWQKVAIGIFATLTLFLAFYVYALKKELRSLTQYIPLGYKLFPDEDPLENEESRTVDGVEMR